MRLSLAKHIPLCSKHEEGAWQAEVKHANLFTRASLPKGFRPSYNGIPGPSRQLGQVPML